MGDDVKVDFGANLEGILGAFNQLKTQGSELAEQLTSAFEGLSAVVTTLEAAFAAVVAVIAGGEAFKEAVSSTVELNDKIRMLTLTLGGTAEEASVLNVALHDIGSSSETYEQAFNKFSRTMRTNEVAIQGFGIQTRDAGGHLRDANTVFMEALKAVEGFKPGLDQTIVAMTMFGRSVQSVHQLQLLLGLDMDEVKAKAQALGLVIGDEEQAALLKYKIAMNEAKDVGEGVWHGLGVQLIPALTQLAQAFSSVGPTIVSTTNGAMKLFIDTLDALKNLFDPVIDSIKLLWRSIVDFLTDTQGKVQLWKDLWTIAFTIAKEAIEAFVIGLQVSFTLIAGAFTQVIDFIDGLINVLDDLAYGEGKKAVEDIGKTFQRMGNDAAESWNQVNKEVMDTLELFEKGIPEKNFGITGDEWEEKKKPPGTKEAPGAAAPADNTPIIKAQIAAEQALNKEGIAVALAMYEDEHRQSKISLQEYYATRLALTQQAIDNEIGARQKLIALWKESQATAATAGDDKGVIAAKAEQVKLEGEIQVLYAKRAEAALESARKELDATTKLNLELVTIREKANAQIAKLDEKRLKESLDYQKAIGVISEQQYIAGEEELENNLYAKQKEGLDARLVLVQDDEKKREEILGQLRVLEAEHQDKLAALERQGQQDRMKYVVEAQNAITSNVESSIQKIIEGHTRLRDILLSFAASIEAAFAKIAAQGATETLFGPGASTGGAAGGVGFLTGLVGTIGSWLSGSGTVAAGAAPPPGVFAEGTNYVPRNMLAMVHQGERIVPASQNKDDTSSNPPPHVTQHINVPQGTTYQTASQIAAAAAQGLRLAFRNN